MELGLGNWFGFGYETLMTYFVRETDKLHETKQREFVWNVTCSHIEKFTENLVDWYETFIIHSLGNFRSCSILFNHAVTRVQTGGSTSFPVATTRNLIRWRFNNLSWENGWFAIHCSFGTFVSSYRIKCNMISPTISRSRWILRQLFRTNFFSRILKNRNKYLANALRSVPFIIIRTIVDSTFAPTVSLLLSSNQRKWNLFGKVCASKKYKNWKILFKIRRFPFRNRLIVDTRYRGLSNAIMSVRKIQKFLRSCQQINLKSWKVLTLIKKNNATSCGRLTFLRFVGKNK